MQVTMTEQSSAKDVNLDKQPEESQFHIGAGGAEESDDNKAAQIFFNLGAKMAYEWESMNDRSLKPEMCLEERKWTTTRNLGMAVWSNQNAIEQRRQIYKRQKRAVVEEFNLSKQHRHQQRGQRRTYIRRQVIVNRNYYITTVENNDGNKV